MIVGYIRVSTEEQNTIRQEVILKDYKPDKIYIEKVSGKNTQRAQLKEMMSFIREDDTLVIESYSRLSRSTSDLLKIVEELTSKGVHFISHKENIDTRTPTGKLMLTIIAGMAQFERECMLDRQREGIVQAKLEGKYKGRKKIEVDASQFEKTYTEWKSNNITAARAMQLLKLKRNTFYKRVAEFEQKNKAKEKSTVID